MKKEETIEVIKKHAKFVSDNNYYYANEDDIEAIADELQTKEISDEEIEAEFPVGSSNAQFGAKWYKNEIKQL